MWTIILLIASIYACKATDYASSSLSHTYVKTSKWNLKTSVSMSVEDNLVKLTLVGPNNVWYSVGFGNKNMDGTYCLVVDGYGQVTERWLIGTTAGDLLDFTWNVESNVESSHYRTVVLSREYDFEFASEYYHQFSTSYSKVETIYAYGSNPDLDDHGQLQRGAEELKASRKSFSNQIENENENEKEEKDELKLWGDASTNVLEEEYAAYLTTSNVITWVTCIALVCVIGWFIFQKWYKNRYNTIPDSCNSNISMVTIQHKAPTATQALV